MTTRQPKSNFLSVDCHTRQGRSACKTKEQFFLEEHDALQPRLPGLFDNDLENLRKSEEELHD